MNFDNHKKSTIKYFIFTLLIALSFLPLSVLGSIVDNDLRGQIYEEGATTLKRKSGQDGAPSDFIPIEPDVSKSEISESKAPSRNAKSITPTSLSNASTATAEKGKDDKSEESLPLRKRQKGLRVVKTILLDDEGCDFLTQIISDSKSFQGVLHSLKNTAYGRLSKDLFYQKLRLFFISHHISVDRIADLKNAVYSLSDWHLCLNKGKVTPSNLNDIPGLVVTLESDQNLIL